MFIYLLMFHRDKCDTGRPNNSVADCVITYLFLND
jgi:hypothetical protein